MVEVHDRGRHFHLELGGARAVVLVLVPVGLEALQLAAFLSAELQVHFQKQAQLVLEAHVAAYDRALRDFGSSAAAAGRPGTSRTSARR